MQYKPHTAALITACAILTAMPATAAVQIKEWGVCEGVGEAACSNYSSGVEFLPAAEGEPYALVANAPLTINGDVALKGPGKLMLNQGAHSVAGKFEFEEGSLEISGSLDLTGDGLLGTITVWNDAAVEEAAPGTVPGKVTFGQGFYSVSSLQVDSGAAVHVAGSSTSELYAPAMVLVGQLARPDLGYSVSAGEMPSAAPAALTVTGDSVFVIGDRLLSAYGKDQKGLNSLLAQGALAKPGTRAVFVSDGTAESQIKDAGVALEVGVTETDPAADAGFTGIRIGSAGRWLLDASGLTTTRASADLKSVTALTGAHLVITGWDGKNPLNLTLDQSWTDDMVTITGTRFWGDFTIENGTLAVTRRDWKDAAGLKARALAGRVETILDAKPEANLALYGAGHSYINDLFDGKGATGHSVETAASAELDSSAFMPAAFGLVQTAQRMQTTAHDMLLSHDVRQNGLLTETNKYWWADVRTGRFDSGDMVSGYDWTYEADITSGILGLDWHFSDKWAVTVAMSAATADIDNNGFVIDGFTAENTAAGAGAALFYDAGTWGTVTAAVTYTAAQGEAKKVEVERRFITEPEIKSLTAGFEWRAVPYGTPDLWWQPAASVSFNTAKVSDGAVRINGGTAVSGTAFETETEKLQWMSFRAGLKAAGSWSYSYFTLTPSAELSAEINTGDTDWNITSRLANDTVTSSVTFNGVPQWRLAASAGFELATSRQIEETEGGIFGFGAKPTGNLIPVYWTLGVKAGGEVAQCGMKGVWAALTYRALF